MIQRHARRSNTRRIRCKSSNVTVVTPFFDRSARVHYFRSAGPLRQSEKCFAFVLLLACEAESLRLVGKRGILLQTEPSGEDVLKN